MYTYDFPKAESLSHDIESPTAPHRFYEKAPFTPLGLLVAPIFLGIGGILLAALNWNRYGKPERFWSTLVMGVGVMVGVMTVCIFLFPSVFDHLLKVYAVYFLSGILYMAWVNGQQKPLYEAWLRANDNRPPTLSQVGGWLPYVGAILLGWGVALAFDFALRNLAALLY